MHYAPHIGIRDAGVCPVTGSGRGAQKYTTSGVVCFIYPLVLCNSLAVKLAVDSKLHLQLSCITTCQPAGIYSYILCFALHRLLHLHLTTLFSNTSNLAAPPPSPSSSQTRVDWKLLNPIATAHSPPPQTIPLPLNLSSLGQTILHFPSASCRPVISPHVILLV